MKVTQGQKWQYKNKSPFRAGGPIVEVVSVDGDEVVLRAKEGNEFTEPVENLAQHYRQVKG